MYSSYSRMNWNGSTCYRLCYTCYFVYSSYSRRNRNRYTCYRQCYTCHLLCSSYSKVLEQKEELEQKHLHLLQILDSERQAKWHYVQQTEELSAEVKKLKEEVSVTVSIKLQASVCKILPPTTAITDRLCHRSRKTVS